MQAINVCGFVNLYQMNCICDPWSYNKAFV